MTGETDTQTDPWDPHSQNADLQTICGNNSTEVQERPGSLEGGGCKVY